MQRHIFKKISAGFLYLNFALIMSATPTTATEGLGQAREAFKVGPWVGAEQFLQNGSFFSCLMVADYGAGRSAAFGINNDHRFWFGLSSQEWRLTSAKSYTLIYRIDQAAHIVVRATAPHSSMLMADFLDRAKVFKQLRAAKVLTVEVPELNEVVHVQLKHADAALSSLANCVDKNTKNAPEVDAENLPDTSKKEI